MSVARGNLQLLPSGELREDAPQTYAEALVQLDERQQDLDGARARADRLAQENEHLTTALGKAHGQVQRLKSDLNKDLRLHKDYATVERLWAKWRAHHPKCREQIPDDYLKMALDRLRDFDEYELSRALDGAIHNPGVNAKTGKVYDQWHNALRSTANVKDFIAQADLAEGRAHRERERHPEVARVLGRLGVARLEDLANVCDSCGVLMILHSGEAAGACGDPDDSWFRSQRWVDEQVERKRRGVAVGEVAEAAIRLYRPDMSGGGESA